MLFTISQYTLISLIIIISVHYIYLYLKDNLTIPKTKDLVEKPKRQYTEIYNTIKKGNQIQIDEENKQTNMKNELKDYLKTLSKNKGLSNGSNISTMNFNNNNVSNYSSY